MRISSVSREVDLPGDAQGQVYVMCLGHHASCSVVGTEFERGRPIVVDHRRREGERKVRLHGAQDSTGESTVIVAYTSKVYSSFDAYDVSMLIKLGFKPEVPEDLVCHMVNRQPGAKLRLPVVVPSDATGVLSPELADHRFRVLASTSVHELLQPGGPLRVVGILGGRGCCGYRDPRCTFRPMP